MENNDANKERQEQKKESVGKLSDKEILLARIELQEARIAELEKQNRHYLELLNGKRNAGQ